MRFYIGFDIGDAESIIELAISANNNVSAATMPGKNAAGQAIPTLFAYDKSGRKLFASQVAADYENLTRVEMNFKRRPSDLLAVSDVRAAQLIGIDVHNLLDEPEFQSGAIYEFQNKLCTFVNIVLTDDNFMERARAFAANCDDSVICVGHPTNWNALDRHIYEAMLLKSVIGEGTYLGIPLQLTLESESRAAFLYIKNTYSVKLKDGEFVGLMDIGSSTIDISVLTKNSRDCVYDSGSNYLGARSIDYLILEYYIKSIQKRRPEDGELLKDILAKNEAAFRSLLINCRFAKETLFSIPEPTPETITRIMFGDMPPVRLNWDTLVNDICKLRPIAPALVKYCGLPQAIADELGTKSWIQAFRSFVQDQLEQMRKQGIIITKLFMTGSASRMCFVREICMELIPELARAESLFNDTNPSNAIANGLARVGVSEVKAEDFRKDMERFLDRKSGPLYDVIRRRIPDLVQDIADPITDAVQNGIVLPAIKAWQKGKYDTLRSMMKDIEYRCKNAEELNRVLSQHEGFIDAVTSWMENKAGHDIAVELQGIAHKHQVYDFTIDQLNAFKELRIKAEDMVDTNGIKIVTKLPSDQIAYALAAVVGVVGFMIIPYVTGFILGLVGLLFETLAISILGALLANPLTTVAGFAAIAVMLGVGLIKGYKQNKQKINEWLLEQRLPKWLREKIDIQQLAGEMKKERAAMVGSISDSLSNPKAVTQLCEGVYGSVYKQVEARADQIRFEIEAR